MSRRFQLESNVSLSTYLWKLQNDQGNAEQLTHPIQLFAICLSLVHKNQNYKLLATFINQFYRQSISRLLSYLELYFHCLRIVCQHFLHLQYFCEVIQSIDIMQLFLAFHYIVSYSLIFQLLMINKFVFFYIVLAAVVVFGSMKQVVSALIAVLVLINKFILKQVKFCILLALWYFVDSLAEYKLAVVGEFAADKLVVLKVVVGKLAFFVVAVDKQAAAVEVVADKPAVADKVVDNTFEQAADKLVVVVVLYKQLYCCVYHQKYVHHIHLIQQQQFDHYLLR